MRAGATVAGAGSRRRSSTAYDEMARAQGLASPLAERSGLLELFVLEKALYELRYEIDNRPDWVRIPLRGLIEALEVLP